MTAGTNALKILNETIKTQKARLEGEQQTAEANQEEIARGTKDLDLSDVEQDLQDIAEQELDGIRERSITKVKDKSSWNNLKKLSRKHYKDKGKFRAFISPEIELKGKVIAKDCEGLIEVNLMTLTYYITKEGDRSEKLFFIDEPIDKRSIGKIDDTYTEDFWIYNFKTGSKDYILLVGKDDKLDYEEYTLTGTQVSISDYADVGKYSRLSTSKNIILLHTAIKRIPKYSNHKDFFAKVKALKLNEGNNLNEFIFSKNGIYYRNPQEYEGLMMALILSCSKDGYPLHFLGIGGAGCGKSTTLEGLHSKSGEQNIFSGSGSTFTALIPSFKGSVVKAGHMRSSNRLCFADEFFKALIRVDDDERAIKLTQMDELLEHKQRLSGSGNCESEGKMTSKFIAVTNPVWGNNTIAQTLNKYEDSLSTISRMLMFYYDPAHIRYIEQQKEQRQQVKVRCVSSDDFLGFYDYIYTIECETEHKKLSEIYKMAQAHLQRKEEYSLILQMWGTRYIHHLSCLLDGIVKERCIKELDDLFTAKPEDYKKLTEMVLYLLGSWNIDIIDNSKVY